MTPDLDRNFDDLAHRFKRNVYDRLKGDIRLAVLRRDLGECIPGFAHFASPPEAGGAPLRVLDAGGGQGQLAVQLAQAGHNVTLCDISSNMLALARDHAAQAGVADNINFCHASVQAFCATAVQPFDVVLCHAVLEWVVEPKALIAALCCVLKPGGYLSLTFYNVNSIVMKNLLRTNFAKVVDEDYRGYRGSLTPTFPRETDQVLEWMAAQAGMGLLCHSGIRCFHDYILAPDDRVKSPGEQLLLELRLSRREPFRSLGRYIHLLYRLEP